MGPCLRWYTAGHTARQAHSKGSSSISLASGARKPASKQACIHACHAVYAFMCAVLAAASACFHAAAADDTTPLHTTSSTACCHTETFRLSLAHSGPEVQALNWRGKAPRWNVPGGSNPKP